MRWFPDQGLPHFHFPFPPFHFFFPDTAYCLVHFPHTPQTQIITRIIINLIVSVTNEPPSARRTRNDKLEKFTRKIRAKSFIPTSARFPRDKPTWAGTFPESGSVMALELFTPSIKTAVRQNNLPKLVSLWIYCPARYCTAVCKPILFAIHTICHKPLQCCYNTGREGRENVSDEIEPVEKSLLFVYIFFFFLRSFYSIFVAIVQFLPLRRDRDQVHVISRVWNIYDAKL